MRYGVKKMSGNAFNVAPGVFDGLRILGRVQDFSKRTPLSILQSTRVP